MKNKEMTLNEYVSVLQKNGINKYRNQKTEVEGIMFDSKKEAARYQELKILQRAGLICELEIQHRFELKVDGQKICDYICDFLYFDKGKEEWVVEDVKSPATKTAVYRLKKKLMRACQGVDIVEV